MTNATSATSKALSPIDLVRAAVLATSPDNNQPWRFVAQGTRLLIHADPERALPSDVGSMFCLMALGAAAENACIAGRQMGYQSQVDLVARPQSQTDDEVAEPSVGIAFTPGAEPDPLFPQVGSRCTNRKRYSSRPVGHESLEAISQSVSRFSEVRLDWVTSRRAIRSFARLVAASDRIRFEYRPFHEELCKQLRFSPEEAQRTRDGLDLRTLELPPGTGLLLRWLQPWSRMQWVHRLGLGRLLTLPSAVSVRKSGTLGVLTVPEPTPEAYLRAGRAFQRLWLAADAQGLALQPLGSLPIFLAHLGQQGAGTLNPKHRSLVGRLAARFRQLVPSAADRVLAILFRLGHASAPSHRSLRRPAEEVFEAEEESQTGAEVNN